METAKPKTRLEIFVEGTPIPKGSWQSRLTNGKDGPKQKFKPDNPRLKGWSDLVRIQAKTSWRGPIIFAGPVRLILNFTLPRTVTINTKAGKSSRNQPGSRTRKGPLPVGHGTGDLDKLVRAVCDSLEGVAFKNDAQVVSLNAEKTFDDKGPAGVSIQVVELDKNVPN